MCGGGGGGEVGGSTLNGQNLLPEMHFLSIKSRVLFLKGCKNRGSNQKVTKIVSPVKMG